jgi:hypothetical protein
VEGLETTIRDPGIQSVVANVTFRDLNKTAILSNDLRVNLDLASEGALDTAEDDTEIGDGATLGEPEQSQDSNPPQEPNQEERGTDTAVSGGEDENEGEGEGEQTIPVFRYSVNLCT